MNAKKPNVVYTAVFGNYDHLPAVNPKWDCDFICFTDNAACVSDGWQLVMVELNGEPPAQANRRYKMLPHVYLKQYKRSLYVDANIALASDPSKLFNKYLESGVVALAKHRLRNCAYEEAVACIDQGKGNKTDIELHMKRYRAEGFPENFGLTENGVLFRNHLDERVMLLMNAWWDEYRGGVERDQLSLPYLFWKYKFNYLELLEGPRISHKYFRIELHNSDKGKSALRKYIQLSFMRKDVSLIYLTSSFLASLLIKCKKIRKIMRV